jgi:DNA polymerase III epsilon subunit-like protein
LIKLSNSVNHLEQCNIFYLFRQVLIVTVKILFLDTETSGMNPKKDNIIEMGAILCSMNESGKTQVIDTFSELISINYPLEEVVTQITGITQTDLNAAPSRNKVQEKWGDWLEKNFNETEDQLVLVGHSLLDFDHKFLLEEGWYLPLNYKCCDTVILSKITYPHFSAVNLDYLRQKLELTKNFNSIISQEKEMRAHRALYDTASTVFLLERIIESLRQYQMPQEFIQILLKHHLPIHNLALDYSAQRELSTADNSEISVDFQYDWNGIKNELSLNDKINMLSQTGVKNFLLQSLENYTDLTTPANYVILQLISGLHLRHKFGWNINFHGMESDFKTAVLLIDWATSSVGIKTNAKSHQTSPLEHLVWQVGNASDIQLQPDKVVSIASFIVDMLEKNSRDEELKKQCLKLINAYDFLFLSVQPRLTTKNYYIYNPATTTLAEEMIYKKMYSFYEQIGQTIGIIEQKTKERLKNLAISSITEYSTLKLLEELKKLDINPDRRYNLMDLKGKLVINQSIYPFDLNSHLNLILDQNTDLLIPTFLTEDEVLELVEIMGLPANNIIPRIIYKRTTQQSPVSDIVERIEVTPQELESIVLQMNEAVKETQYPVLILAGQNSTYNNLEKTIKDNLKPEDYLIIGVSGSKVKIMSKLQTGTKAIALLKQKDIPFLRNYGHIAFCKILTIDNYHFYPAFYWKDRGIDSQRFQKFLNRSSDNMLRFIFDC